MLNYLKVLISIHISSLFEFCSFSFFFFWLPSIVSDIGFFCIILLVLVILVVTL